MKAIVYDRFGPPGVLELRDVPEPTRSPELVRVRVQAAALNPKDVLLRKGKLRLLVRGPFPRIPGYDLAGELLDDANGIAAGSRVYGMIGSGPGGACAEIAALPANEIAPAPVGLSTAEAASLPLAALTALQALRDELLVKAGQRLLINGASGGVGTLAVQIAKSMGADVAAVCSGRNGELVTELGADRVIDYTQQRVADQRGFDAVFDVYGNLPWAKAQPMLGEHGRYCTTVPGPGSIARGALRRLQLHRAALVVVRSRRRDLEHLRRLVESGQVRPVVDRVLPLAQSREAHEYLETRRARGKVVLDLTV